MLPFICLHFFITFSQCSTIIRIPILPNYYPSAIRPFPTPYPHLLHTIDEISYRIAADMTMRFESPMVQLKNFCRDRTEVLNTFYPNATSKIFVGNIHKRFVKIFQPYKYTRLRNGVSFYISAFKDNHLTMVKFNASIRGDVDQEKLEGMLAKYPNIVKVLNPLGPDGARSLMVPFPLLPNYNPEYIGHVSYQELFQMLKHAAINFDRPKVVPHHEDPLVVFYGQLEHNLQMLLPGSTIHQILLPKKRT